MDTKTKLAQFLSDNSISAAEASAALVQIQSEAAINAAVEAAVKPLRDDLAKLAADFAAIPGE